MIVRRNVNEKRKRKRDKVKEKRKTKKEETLCHFAPLGFTAPENPSFEPLYLISSGGQKPTEKP